jgi:hypothetical protein
MIARTCVAARAALVLLACTTSAAAVGQPGQTAPAIPATELAAASTDSRRCELHVWGGERFQAHSSGLLGGMGLLGGLIDGAMHARENRENVGRLGGALDTQGQVAALAAVDLPAALNLPNHVVVQHDEPMDPARANRNQGRHAASASPCYAELMVTRLLYQRTPIYGRTLRASFLYRDFGNAARPAFTFAGRGGNGLRLFPAREESQIEAANAELVDVYKANFSEYVRNLLSRRNQRRR